jgi:hypothetical protein
MNFNFRGTELAWTAGQESWQELQLLMPLLLEDAQLQAAQGGMDDDDDE